MKQNIINSVIFRNAKYLASSIFTLFYILNFLLEVTQLISYVLYYIAENSVFEEYQRMWLKVI